MYKSLAVFLYAALFSNFLMAGLGERLPTENDDNFYNSREANEEKLSINYRDIENQLSQWVNWNKKGNIAGPEQVLRAVMYRYSFTRLPENFYDNLSEVDNDFSVLISNLSEAQLNVINEAAILYFKSFDKYYRFLVEIEPLEIVRNNYLKSLKYDLELYTIVDGVEPSVEDRHYLFDLFRTAVISVARQLYKEEYGITALNRLDISHDKMLFIYLKIKAEQWQEKFDIDGDLIVTPHPYARIAAFFNKDNELYNAIIHHKKYNDFMDNLGHENSEIKLRQYVSNTNRKLRNLGRVPNWYSKLGATIYNTVAANPRRSVSDELTKVAGSVSSLLTVGFMFSVTYESQAYLLSGISVSDSYEAIALRTHELASDASQVINAASTELESVEAEIPLDTNIASPVSLLMNDMLGIGTEQALVPESQVGELLDEEKQLFAYSGEDNIVGTDYVIKQNNNAYRIRRFPHTNDYALFDPSATFGTQAIFRNDQGGWQKLKTVSTLGGAIVSEELFDSWVINGDRRYVLQLGRGEPSVVFSSYAKSVMSRYDVPPENFFGDGKRQSNAISHLFPVIKSNSYPLLHLTENDRLDIVAHGNPFGPISETGNGIEQALSAGELAKKLKAFGLTEIGVLKFQSCRIGSAAYLFQLRSALTAEGISFGYLSAPKGYLMQPRFSSLPRVVFDPFPLFNKDRYEVLRGDLDVSFPNTRYMRD